MTRDRPYVYKDVVKIPEVDVPTTPGGLGKGRSTYITFDDRKILVRLHKYTNSVASDEYGNVYMESGVRINHGTFIRTWIRDVEKSKVCTYKSNSNQPCKTCPRVISALYRCGILQEIKE
jgi:hypothetical protein